MLVGAGGNAGNQAAVRVIRRIALGKLSSRNYFSFFLDEIYMAFALCMVLGIVGLVRCLISMSDLSEALAITFSLISIVFTSVLCGSLLPMILFYFKLDPAHSSTSIQVIMDILGVYITCTLSTFLLDTSFGKNIMRFGGFMV
jgi:Mg/Co/Ni transporter MgtE